MTIRDLSFLRSRSNLLRGASLESSLSALEVYTLGSYFEIGANVLRCPAMLLRRVDQKVQIAADFGLGTPERSLTYYREKHEREEFSVVIANAELDPVNRVLAVAAIKYVMSYHGIVNDLLVTAEDVVQIKNMILEEGPRRIKIRDEIPWKSWKQTNKNDIVKGIRFRLKANDHQTSLVVGHKAKVFIEKEFAP